MTLKQLVKASGVAPASVGLQPERVHLETTGAGPCFNIRIRRTHKPDLKTGALKSQAEMERRRNGTRAPTLMKYLHDPLHQLSRCLATPSAARYIAAGCA